MSWQAVNWVMYESEVDDYVQFRVLMLLAKRADSEGCGAWPSQEELSKAVRRTDRTVRRALKALSEAGHIRKGDRSLVPPSAKGCVVYDLVMSESAASELYDDDSDRTSDVRSGISDRTQGVQTDRTQGVQTDRTSDVHRTNQLTNHPLRGTRQSAPRQSPILTLVTDQMAEAAKPDLFPAFWDAYPKHAKRDEARTAWDAAIDDGADPQELITAAQRFAEDAETQRLMRSPYERRFVQYARSWLNDEAWRDWGQTVEPASSANPLSKNASGADIDQAVDAATEEALREIRTNTQATA